MNLALELDAIQLSYAEQAVLHGVSLQLRGGELTGLIGPNGSGKSSLMRVIAGVQAGAHGAVRIMGIDLHAEPQRARQQLGYAIEPARLPALLSGRQCIELIADLRGVAADLHTSWALCDALRLTPWLDAMVATYSLGTRQKLAIVQALLGAPQLIVLDEVLNGLDPLAAYALKAELRQRADAGAAVLLATHGLDVAERLVDRVLLLADGRLIEDWDAHALAQFRLDPDGGLEHAVAERLTRSR